MADDHRRTILLWAAVMKAAETGPTARIDCPFCAAGEIVVHDVASEADRTRGERLFRCTNCDHSTEARISFGTAGPLFAPPRKGPAEPDSRAALDFADRAASLVRDENVAPQRR